MFSTGVGSPGTFHGMFAFQHLQASDKCYKTNTSCFNEVEHHMHNINTGKQIKRKTTSPSDQATSFVFITCKIVLALFAFIPSGIMSTISCITDARSSKSKWLSTRCFVTVFATPFEWRPSNWRDSRFPSQRSRSGVMPLKKKSQTLQPGAQNPHPGPLPTGP